MSQNNQRDPVPSNHQQIDPHTNDTSSTPNPISFETIYQQNKNRIHYQMHKLGLHDPHNEFFTEGIYAMWQAYKKYQPTKGPMGTYFNYQIRYSLIDMLRRNTRALNNADEATQQHGADLHQGNYAGAMKRPVLDTSGISTQNTTFWNFVRSRLTANQWTWVRAYILEGLSQQEIADMEGVSVDAVKSWAREARKRLHKEEDNLKNML